MYTRKRGIFIKRYIKLENEYIVLRCYVYIKKEVSI